MHHARRYKKASSRLARRERARRAASLVFGIGAPAALLIAMLLLARSSALQIKDFQISGGEATGQEAIHNAALSFAAGTEYLLLPKSNIVLINADKLAGSLMSQFTRIENIEVDKNLFNRTVSLSIKERGADFLWCSIDGTCFFMDSTGLLFERAPGGDLGKIIFGGSIEGDPLMKRLASQEEMVIYTSLVRHIEDAGLKVSAFEIQADDKVSVSTDAGDIIFNPHDKDLSSLVQNAALLINDMKAKNPSARFEYIDARFGNKLFYKLY